MILFGWKRRLEHIILIGLVLGAGDATINAAPSLTLRIGRDTISVIDSTTTLTVFITNPLDHIAGFELRLMLNRPDLAVFTGDFDTTGSVIGGWEYLRAVVQDNGSKFHLAGLAEMNPPYNHPPVFPSATERTLIRAALRIKPVSDTVTARTGYVQFDTSLQYFGLANDMGELIGLKQDTTFDTLLYRCLQYEDTGCVLWQRVLAEPFDRLVVDTTLHPYIDTGYIGLIPGSITVLRNCTSIQNPGDVNLDGTTSSDDLLALQVYVTNGIPELASSHNADLNGDSCVGVADVMLLERYLEFGPDSVTIADCSIHNQSRCCCVGKRGNVTADARDMVDLSDLSHLISYLTSGGTLPCPKEADWNGSGVTDLSDLSGMTAYLTGGGGIARDCP